MIAIMMKRAYSIRYMIKIIFLLITVFKLSYTIITSEFEITIDDSTEGNIKLNCNYGCAWKSLTFSCPSNTCDSKIDQFGLYNKEDHHTVENLADFIIKISREENNYTFFCEKGCVWKTFSQSTQNTEKNNFAFTEKGFTY
jgi:hypothetical protein